MTMLFLTLTTLIDVSMARALSVWVTFFLLMLTAGLMLGGIVIVFIQALAAERMHR
jgi:hypothetical protein